MLRVDENHVEGIAVEVGGCRFALAAGQSVWDEKACQTEITLDSESPPCDIRWNAWGWLKVGVFGETPVNPQ